MDRSELNGAAGQAQPPLADYAYISDCHSCALVSRSGSIDWCCMPRIDGGSCFGRLLDWERGGHCTIMPVGPFESSRRYVGDTLVLETIFTTGTGRVRLVDCLAMRKGGAERPHEQILRMVEGLEGSVEFRVTIAPRFEYGLIKPWIRALSATRFAAIGGSSGLLFSGNLPVQMTDHHNLEGQTTVKKGEKRYLSILYRRPETLDLGNLASPSVDELADRLEETIDWWKRWISQARHHAALPEPVRRSALILKGLSNAPTGAIAAAPTTSLPETPEGMRNWDYRFSWIRDSFFSVRSLAVLGYVREADGFRRFTERSAAGSADEIQVLYGVGGERRLPEWEIGDLSGYGGAKPVRIGNGAVNQTQLDVYGELLELSWRWHRRGHSPDDDYWHFIVKLVNAACRLWRDPDRGIWEMRGKPRHFVHSKAMCWVALDRGIRLAEDLARDAPIGRWKKERDEIRRAVEENGYEKKRGAFIQAFDHPVMDASLLLLPVVGFVDFDDDRMVRTADAVREHLSEDGLIRRYPPGDEGLEGKEGTFLACSFWLSECLARQGRIFDARQIYDRALSTGNDLCLFSEEWDPETGRMLGNFPQGLTHLSLISAAISLSLVPVDEKGGRGSQKDKEGAWRQKT